MVSGLGRVILILFVITAELSASYQQNFESAVMICLTKPVVFIPDARPVFYVNMWHGTQLLKALCNTLRYEDIAMLLCMLCVELWMFYECDIEVLWMCYECVTNVLRMCYECVMNVLWMCYGCVMDALGMCYGYVMDVWGCMRDGWMMDILYLLCKLYCEWYFNCDIVVASWYDCYVNYCILFFRAF